MPHEFAQRVLEKIGGVEGLQDSYRGRAEPPVPEPVEGGITDEPEPQPSAERPRGPDGRFVSEKPADPDDTFLDHELGDEPVKPSVQQEEDDALPSDEPPPADGEEEPYVFEVDDPQVAAYLAQHNNDLGKALKTAAEAQTLIGRQSSEVGEVRAQLAEMQALLEQQVAYQQQPQQPQQMMLPPGYLDQMMQQDPKSAAQAAYQYGDYDAMARAVELWKDPEVGDDPFGAAVFVTSIQNNLAMQQMQQQLAAAQQYTNGYSPQQQEEPLETEVQRVMDKHPDIEQYIPAIQQIANENPVFLQALQYGSSKERAAALESLTQLAKSRQGAANSSEAIARVQVRVRAENEDAKRKAAVVSAGRRGAQAEPDNVEQWKRAFRAKTGLPDLEIE